MELENKIIEIVRENIEYKGDIELNDHLITVLHVDSFDMLMIINAIEDEFSIQINDDEIKDIQFVSDIVDKLRPLVNF